MQFYDRVTISSRQRTPEGYLIARARLSRSGIQDYRRGEIGLDGDPHDIVKVYRPADEVFKPESMQSFALKPVTDDHPSEMVTAENFKHLAVGMSSEKIERDGDYTRATLLITQRDAIAKIENGKAEISLGYTVDLEIAKGKTPDGTAFDAVQRNILGNHIALVDAGRCGSGCRIDDRQTGDAACECASCRQKKESEMTDKPKTVLVDGVPVESLDEAVRIINKKQEQLDDLKAKFREIGDDIHKADMRHAEVIKTKDDEIATLKAATSADEIDKRAEDRLSIVLAAADFLPQDYETRAKSNSQIMKDAVSAALGADKVSGKSDDYIRAMFDGLADDEVSPSIGGALAPRRRAHDAYDNGRDGYKKRMGDAWKNQPAAATA